MTKENPAPIAKPMMSMNAIIVPAVSACFASTVLEKKTKQDNVNCTDNKFLDGYWSSECLFLM